MTLELLAFAKLNLSLQVVARRADGFHELDSVVQTIDLADRITIEIGGSSLRVQNDLSVLVGRDLAERAAEAVLTEKGSSTGIRIRIRKGIPAGAGLGGGSSDAAAVLWAVDRLTEPGLPRGRLVELAAELGSDVPLFLQGGQARMTGRGEHLAQMDEIRQEYFVLLVPPVHCETAKVFASWANHPSEAHATSHALGENDLLHPAVENYPSLGRYRDAIERLDAEYAGMSGSGSTFFAAYKEQALACNVMDTLRVAFPEAQVFVCAPTRAGRRLLGGA